MLGYNNKITKTQKNKKMESQKDTYCLRNFFNKIIKFIDKFNNYIIIASDDGNTVLVDLLYNDNVNKSYSKNNFL
uniref:Uncharacterized protein n=1 Tax=Moumouvirus sp. 'Monve' TaxID=1128131 RepID=H2EFD9_9VIRU|nr:hypothetical protein mv_R1002 [Moumouvirus Monve]